MILDLPIPNSYRVNSTICTRFKITSRFLKIVLFVFFHFNDFNCCFIFNQCIYNYRHNKSCAAVLLVFSLAGAAFAKATILLVKTSYALHLHEVEMDAGDRSYISAASLGCPLQTKTYVRRSVQIRRRSFLQIRPPVSRGVSAAVERSSSPPVGVYSSVCLLPVCR